MIPAGPVPPRGVGIDGAPVAQQPGLPVGRRQSMAEGRVRPPCGAGAGTGSYGATFHVRTHRTRLPVDAARRVPGARAG
ncbi:hypothetical protein [Lysobacter sp. N42]|uniref:hypothetical protein n=1 Tax=Lysobacter sp. N42 TaxID=2545719 RepID=UPI00104466EE|nr:hypothetical protein [Lysobacter sp. N42]TCZ82807.1 hypothetical protein EYQ95_22410 [Lysobacter sp. N42]